MISGLAYILTPMRTFPALFLALGLLPAACGPSSSQPPASAPGSPAPAAAAPAPSGVQPPYPLEDSARIQQVEGVGIYVVEEGQGPYPQPSSHVVIRYHGMLRDGSVFDSSFERGETADFSLSNLIRGWQIALPKVRAGSKVKLIIPPDLGYGSQARPKIPANSTLIFDIELITTY
jgi:hypothetical protein